MTEDVNLITGEVKVVETKHYDWKRHMSIKAMTPMDIYHSLIRNGFKEKLDKKGVPLGSSGVPSQTHRHQALGYG